MSEEEDDDLISSQLSVINMQEALEVTPQLLEHPHSSLELWTLAAFQIET